MIAEMEKAQLMVQILDKFAPYMDQSTDLFHNMGGMISSFGALVESFSDLPEEKRTAFMSFIRVFNQYIEQNAANYNDLRGFYSYMTSSTNIIIAEYRAAIGAE